MADITTSRPCPRYGNPETTALPIMYAGVAANLLLFAGAMIALDASGNMVKPDAAGAVQIVGVNRKVLYNRTTDPSGGAAGAVVGEYEIGVFPMYINTDGGAITAATPKGTIVYAVDDQTVSLSSSAGTRLPAGSFVGIDAFGNPQNRGLAMIGVGMGAAVSPAGQGNVLRMNVPLPLATIQAQASGVAFSVGAPLPANARVVGEAINVATALSGGGLSAAVMTLQGGTDAAGSMIASTSVFTGGSAQIATPGSNPYPSRGGQQIKATITATGATLAAITAGVLSVDIFYVVAN